MRLDMRANETPGKLVVFCGVDGAGKSTLIAHAAGHLEDTGKRFTVLKMPSDRIRKMDIFRDYHDSHDEKARKAASDLALTILVSGDRMISLEQDIIPWLKSGMWVLCDRYVFSGLACADGPITRLIANEFIRPDLAFLADARGETVKARVKARPDETSKFYDEKDTEKKRAKFLELANDLPFFRIINTENPREENRQAVIRHLLELEHSRDRKL